MVIYAIRYYENLRQSQLDLNNYKMKLHLPFNWYLLFQMSVLQKSILGQFYLNETSSYSLR